MDNMQKTTLNQRQILNDLMMTIEYIITDISCVEISTEGSTVICKINNDLNHPTILLKYNKDVNGIQNPAHNVETKNERPSLLDNENKNMISVSNIYNKNHLNDGGKGRDLHRKVPQSNSYETPLMDLVPVEKLITFIEGSSFLLANLKRYESSNSGKEFHLCKFCGSSFETLLLKKQHERVHFGETANFSCTYCEKKFHGLNDKKRHERIHTGERPYKCDYCDKTFSRPSNKKAHERTHTGEKPYRCKYCQKDFACLTKAKIHERAHTGEKPYECNYCDKTFSSTTCKIQHERIHTGVKPYKCNFCSKCFTQLNQRITHERTHTGEKPYSCDFCNKKLSSFDRKKTHENIHKRHFNL